MKKILIALDYDPSAETIAEVGYSLAKAIDAEVILMHVISDPVIYSSNGGHVTIVGFAGCMDAATATMQEDCKEEYKKAAQQFLDKSKKHLGDETIQTIVKDGECAESILKTAAEIKADIIILGSHGRKWLEQKVMGSVTESVLHHTTIPLFIIPSVKNH
jgi:nucleotide-binding universal stress UspA family protein